MVFGTCKVDNLYALVTDRPAHNLGHLGRRRPSPAPLTIRFVWRVDSPSRTVGLIYSFHRTTLLAPVLVPHYSGYFACPS